MKIESQERYLGLKDGECKKLTKENLKLHVADSTAVLTILTPVASFIDTYFAGMSNEEAIKARFLVGGLTLFGFGSVISRSGEIYRKSKNFFSSKLLKLPDLSSYSINKPMNNELKERKNYFLGDAIRLAGVSLLASPLLYLNFGVTDIKEIVAGTLATAALSPVILGMTNVTRNVAGLKTSYPINYFKNLNSRARIGLVASIGTIASFLTYGSYELNKEKIVPSAYPQKGVELVDSEVPKRKSLENCVID